ncbi:hypothetical protein CERSUDRAFT_77066 [Gelatoporia subvermispora B]|uniref:Uncharacterized protein n=1 Tax=Ceriporiopsis subvermispora (strain B) TaxID=914234 RepID=M2QLL6_CERS8|nr:hypothetical protein CERSUDRAFT_77066 [Gelatoporia subvermispora B]
MPKILSSIPETPHHSLVPARGKRNKISRGPPPHASVAHSDSLDLAPTPHPQWLPPTVRCYLSDDNWQIDQCALDRVTSQTRLVRCGLRTFLGVENGAVFGMLFVHKRKGRRFPGGREHDRHTLYFVAAAHDQCNPITLISFSPQIILARCEKYPNTRGPTWTRFKHWSLQTPHEFVTTHVWMRGWLGYLSNNATHLAQIQQLQAVQDWLKPIEIYALAGFSPCCGDSATEIVDSDSDGSMVKAEPAE